MIVGPIILDDFWFPSPNALLLVLPQLRVTVQNLHDQLPLRVREVGQVNHFFHLGHADYFMGPSWKTGWFQDRFLETD